jgi:hypothetical protein
MPSRHRSAAPGHPGIDQVEAEIAYFRACILAAGPATTPRGRAARDTYQPFLERRLRLLAALRDGRGAHWRDYPSLRAISRPAGRASGPPTIALTPWR